MPTSVALQRNQLGQYIPVHYHYQMLSDASRMQAFAAAIRRRVRPGMRVADLGSGTGALSFFAAQSGAKVWAVEGIAELAQMSEKFLAANGVTDRVEVVMADAAHWLPPEPVDIVLCEMLHSALLREKQTEVLQRFREGHLKKFGSAPTFLPEATLLAVQPVTQDYCFDGYSAAIPLFQSAYSHSADCLVRGEPVIYTTVDYDAVVDEMILGKVQCVVSQAATINALRFVTRSVLAMDLQSGTTIDWYNQHLIIPLSAPLSLGEGCALQVQFEYRPGDPISALMESLQVTVVDVSVAVS